MFKKLKKPVAFLALGFGVGFTGLILLNVWGLLEMRPDKLVTRLTISSGVLTVAMITLLAIIKMMEGKKR